MTTVKFTSNLNRFFPELKPLKVSGKTVFEALIEVEKTYEGLKDYVVDEKGRLRKHINIYIGNDMISDRINLSDNLIDADEIHIIQALSGG